MGTKLNDNEVKEVARMQQMIDTYKGFLHNDRKMFKYRWPRKHKKRWKASIAKRYGVKPSEIKLKKEVAWEYIKSVEEDIENINKGLNTFTLS